MSLDISINSTNYLPQFYSDLFSLSFDSFKISYILLLGIIVLAFVTIFALFGNSVESANSTGKTNSTMFVIEIILWILLILIVGINLTNYDYDFSLKNIFNSLTAELDINVSGNDDDDDDEEECKPKKDSSGCLIHEDKTKEDMLLEWADSAQEKDPELKKKFEKYLISEGIKSVDPELSKEFEKFVKEKEKEDKKKEEEEERKKQEKKCKQSQGWQIFQIILLSVLMASFVSFFSKFIFGIIVFFVVIFIFHITGYVNDCGIYSNENKKGEEEVFHIPNNTYCYEKSRSICNKYNARLATYTEVEDAYNNGANWCSYGWSEDQLALFPTQIDIYEKLKKFPGHENDCGRPGINGGFINNTNVKFGVNCYGKKPEETDEDKEYMERLKLSYSPAIDQEELDKITKEKNNMLIAPFNKDKWSYV